MSRWKLAVVLCCVSFCLFAAADPFSGQWKLNPSKSKLPPPLPQSQVSFIEADATHIRVREEIINDKGEHMTITVDARFDGKEYPIVGTPAADTVVYQRVNSRTLKGVARKDGKVVLNETVVVSPDGKTLTGTYHGTDATGRQVWAVAVFEKQ
ncbi:MAG: hypothetical protein LAO21_21095 [Acidobacteriia bacterium]|nr:hypothetical protein [Terriglobia bacterium]